MEEENAVMQETTEEIVAVEEPKIEESKNVTKSVAFEFQKAMLFPIAALVLGLVIIVMGTNVMHKTAEEEAFGTKSVYASNYSVNLYSFGADFYTEMYKTNYTMVQELNDINSNVAACATNVDHLSKGMSAGVAAMMNTVNYAAGMMMVVIGLATVAFSLLGFARFF